MIPPIQSLSQLSKKAETNSDYRNLLCLAALTYKPAAVIDNIAQAAAIIEREIDLADDPDDVIDEINGLRSQLR